MAKFVYFICNTSSSDLLKDELKKKHPYFNLAFSKDSFLTFKRSDSKNTDLNFDHKCIFARAMGISLGKGKRSEIGKIIQEELMSFSKEHFVIHEWIKDENQWCLKEEFSNFINLKDHSELELNDLIIDIVKISDNSYFLGLRKYREWETPFIAGVPDFTCPEEAPSRAWLKTEEALRWTRAPLKETDTILEIGSAPGGSVYNFLKRNHHVIGVDTGEMSPLCLEHPNYKHLNLTMQKLNASTLGMSIHWLTIDINQKPNYTLRELKRILPLIKKDLKGIFLTLKLTDNEAIKRLDSYVTELKELGFQVHPTQLYNNRNEVFFYGLRAG